MIDLQIVIPKIIKWIVTQIKIEHIKTILNKFRRLNDFEKIELKILRIIDTQIKAGNYKVACNCFSDIEANFLKQREYVNSLIEKQYITGRIKDFNSNNGGANQFIIFDCTITHAGEQYLKAHKRCK